jgi:DNA-binding transcriptional MerR regulator
MTPEKTDQSGFLTIGEVVRELKDEFPDLSISKVRYLEEQDIITPERTAGGYRKFSPHMLERLRLSLKLQRDHFLPLHVIREKLRDAERGAVMEDNVGTVSVPVLETMTLALDDAGQVALEDVVGSLGVPAEFIRAIEGFGLITIKQTDKGKVLDAADVDVVHAAHDMTKYGMEPRHLRMYETFAERQVSFFAQILLPGARQKSPEASQRTASTLSDLASKADILNKLLLRRAMASEFRDFSG